ncbi:MAG TPA: hypothetical protein VG944_21730 [Fimbriimonas sp.]|nr:hypothetical protein [Fimbriimonas sp.]
MSAIVIPKAEGRGAGLGNEMMVWAKSFLGAQAIGGKSKPPAFGLNVRPYYRYFKTPRYDWLLYRALARLNPPANTFTQKAFLEHYDPDFGIAFKNWYESLGRHPRVTFVEGLWGGYNAIWRARHFLMGKLLSTPYTAENIAAKLPPSSAKTPLRIGVHLRTGDFDAMLLEHDKVRWNRRLPVGWYQGAMRACVKAFGPDFQFVMVTDATPQEAAPFLDEFHPVTTFDQQNTVISDMVLLSTCDVVIPSLSSFTFAALMLGEPFYIWPLEHPVKKDGWMALWGDRPDVDAANIMAAEEHRQLHLNAPQPLKSRCLYYEDGAELPRTFVDLVCDRHERKQPFTDPMRNGVARIGAEYR